ncbi:hypothetical protein [Nocardia sputi]|uniref:hypothetical protein n=1 Tax=Nocardia sputi TaxID=2943705 RepID=UPI0020BF9DC5|nr:hypothetical protein [Nocardia sputi]
MTIADTTLHRRPCREKDVARPHSTPVCGDDFHEYTGLTEQYSDGHTLIEQICDYAPTSDG